MSITPQKLRQLTKENMKERLGWMLTVINASVSSQLQSYQRYLADYPPGSLGRDEILAAIQARKIVIEPAVCYYLRMKDIKQEKARKAKEDESYLQRLINWIRGSKKEAVISEKKKLDQQKPSKHKQEKSSTDSSQQQSKPLIADHTVLTKNRLGSRNQNKHKKTCKRKWW